MLHRDGVARAAAGLEIIAIALNLVIAGLWFATFVWALAGVFWLFVGVMLLVQITLATFVLKHGHSPISVMSPLLGLAASLCNVNLIGVVIEGFVLMVLVFGLILPTGDRQAHISVA